MENKIKVEFSSLSKNESFARVVIAAFAAQLDPTLDELSDIKTAVSEAVTNAIIHGYGNESEGNFVKLEATIIENEFTVKVIDNGAGIDNVDMAMQPLYTSRPDLERSGMGFTVMETFMDSLIVESVKGEGTTVTMKKAFNTVR
ncbi:MULTISPECIES: anti-sigma F factor [Clostridium]|uniref:Anti-sigma F factor n=1 Tax=Clostridium sulfidigenes TaxID=318464 RepID=A0A084J928_9CLOT|nr:anti-sigma F factor [Clostridium sulfidigenes]KEZ85462.1 anti-sigma F factor [Clostridium sulfidigenes]MBE6060417.1 anti-sigma F factor [Clostridium sulfidigenes]HBA03113.1 anti-sigma F factor [Clostridium sp.]HCO73299.1 anti-sigma F factor [Clostridium sp.]